MIHLIMVLCATTTLPSCASMDSASFRSFEEDRKSLTSTNQILAEGAVTAPMTERPILHPVASSWSEPVGLKPNVVQTLVQLSSEENDDSRLGSERLKRRRLHSQGFDSSHNHGKKLKPLLQSTKSSHHRPTLRFHRTLHKIRLTKKIIRNRNLIAFKNSRSALNANGRKSSESLGLKLTDVSTVTSDELNNDKNSNNSNNNEPLRMIQIPSEDISNSIDNHLTDSFPRTLKANTETDINCNRVKRDTETEVSPVKVPTTKGPRIRHSAQVRNDSEHVGSSERGDAMSSSTNGTTATTRRGKRRRRGRRRQRQSNDLSLWIDERQVKLFSGYVMEIYVIHDGKVLPYILDPNFEKHLPVIPFEVQNVNFTWRAGRKRYYYTFDRLYSHDPSILDAPVVSLPSQGRIPRKPKVFTVNINCSGNASGIASFDIGLLIQTRRGKPMPGMPLRLKLRKECTQPSADPECDEKCENGGVCDTGRRCQCPEGYMGPYCNTALCYPQCMNGGTCTTPGRCSCPPGYQGRHCEGGICRNKCENGGKCIQKDTCDCPRGYYGNRCEFSKCVIPCINGGKCRNVNKCRCPHGFSGDHCEVVTSPAAGGASGVVRCSRKCRHGSCRGTTCVCEEGFTGRWCRRRGIKKKRVWM